MRRRFERSAERALGPHAALEPIQRLFGGIEVSGSKRRDVLHPKRRSTPCHRVGIGIQRCAHRLQPLPQAQQAICVDQPGFPPYLERTSHDRNGIGCCEGTPRTGVPATVAA